MKTQEGEAVTEAWVVFFSWHVRLRHSMKTLARKGGAIKETDGENGEKLSAALEKVSLADREPGTPDACPSALAICLSVCLRACVRFLVTTSL